MADERVRTVGHEPACFREHTEAAAQRECRDQHPRDSRARRSARRAITTAGEAASLGALSTAGTMTAAHSEVRHRLPRTTQRWDRG